MSESQRVFGLGSDERREVVDYLTGRGLAMERFSSGSTDGGRLGIRRCYALALLLQVPQDGAAGSIEPLSRSSNACAALMKSKCNYNAYKSKGIGPINATSRFYRSMQGEMCWRSIRRGNLDILQG